MKWLFVIDPIEFLHEKTDTSLLLMREVAKQGIDVYYCIIQELFYDQTVACRAHRFGEMFEEDLLLDNFDLILMRKEPPYDLQFHYATKLLSLTTSRVVNSPQTLRNFNEKLIILQFPDLIPPTLVTGDVEKINQFQEKYGLLVLKYLDSHQGRKVEKVDARTLVSLKEKEIVMVQQYLPKVTEGDKRVLLLGGKFLGVVQRVPKEGSYLTNFGQGAKGHKTKLTKQEEQIVARIGPFLYDQGIHFAGLDLLDGKLIEINITCPTGIQQINTLEDVHLEKEVVEYFKGLG